MRLKYVLLLLVMCLFFSCEKTLSCLVRSKGDVSEVLQVGTYKKLHVQGRVDVELSYGEAHTEIHTDKSLLDEVEWFVEEGVLHVKFLPTCKTFKDRSVKLVVSSKNIEIIMHKGEGRIRSINTLEYSSLTLEVGDELVQVNLWLDVGVIGVSTRGISSFVFSGKSNQIWVSNHAGDGGTDASNLVVNEAIIDHKGTNDIRVNCLERLDVKCKSTGDVLVYSKPIKVTEENLNTGKIRYK